MLKPLASVKACWSGLFFLAIFALAFASPDAFGAVNCVVVRHRAPTEADSAYLSGDFEKAEQLYQAELKKTPGAEDSAEGYVHALLKQQRVIEAEDAVKTLTTGTAIPAALLTLRGEVELREGAPWAAMATAGASAKLDPCNPRTMLLLARLMELDSRHLTAKKLLTSAHAVDPSDPEIWIAWMDTLPVSERIQQLENYQAAPRGDSDAMVKGRNTELEWLKAWNAEPHKPCTLASKSSTAKIPLSPIRTIYGFDSDTAVDVSVNDRSIRLAFDTSYNPRLPIPDVSGLLILKSAADKMGLKPIFHNMVPGTSLDRPRSGYVAYADKIKIGDVEFQNCVVQVMEGRFWNDADGAISPSLFSDFLVTFDYPGHRLYLNPLPALPDKLRSGALTDRYIAPEMKDFTQIYKAGTDPIVPVLVNQKFLKLFLVDTARSFTSLAPEDAHEVASGQVNKIYEVRKGNPFPDLTFTAGNVSLKFLNLSQEMNRIPTFVTSIFTSDAGTHIGGIFGDSALKLVTMQVDYRDGLMKMQFDSHPPK